MKWFAALLVLGITLAAGASLADAPPPGIGVEAQAGVGTSQFVGSTGADATNGGAAWDVRAVVGSSLPVGVELGYAGGIQGIEGFGAQEGALLVDNGVQGALRLAAPIELDVVEVKPFASAGLGFSRYDVVHDDGNSGNLRDGDHVLTVPAAVGLQLGIDRASIEGRVGYEHAFDSELFGAAPTGFEENALSAWEAGVSVGLEF